MQEHIPTALQIVGTLSLIATFTPTPKDDGILYILKQILNFAGGNFGHAKNAADRDVEQEIEKVYGKEAKAGLKKVTKLLRR